MNQKVKIIFLTNHSTFIYEGDEKEVYLIEFLIGKKRQDDRNLLAKNLIFHQFYYRLVKPQLFLENQSFRLTNKV